MKRHEDFLARARKGNVDLLFLGDSITAGWDMSGRDVWDRYYAPRRAANFGIGGDLTQNVLWRLENGEVGTIQPKVVVLMIGTNNLVSNPPDEIADGIETIIKKLHEKLPAAKVLLLGILPRAEKPDQPVRAKVAAVNRLIARLDNRATVRYLDIGPKFLNEDGTISPEVMPDFLHLSRKGYRIWAETIEPTLWSMLDEKGN